MRTEAQSIEQPVGALYKFLELGFLAVVEQSRRVEQQQLLIFHHGGRKEDGEFLHSFPVILGVLSYIFDLEYAHMFLIVKPTTEEDP